MQFANPLSSTISTFTGSAILTNKTALPVTGGSLSGSVECPLQFRGMAISFLCADLPNQTVNVQVWGGVSGNVYYSQTLQNNGNGNAIFTTFDILPEAELDASGNGQFWYGINFTPGTPTQNINFTLVAIADVFRPFNAPYVSTTENYSRSVQLDASGAATVTITPDPKVRILQIGFYRVSGAVQAFGCEVTIQGATSRHLYYDRNHPNFSDNGLNDYAYINPDLDTQYSVLFRGFPANSVLFFTASAVSSAPVTTLQPSGETSPVYYPVQTREPVTDKFIPALIVIAGATDQTLLNAPGVAGTFYRIVRVFISNPGGATVQGNLFFGGTAASNNLHVWSVLAGQMITIECNLIISAATRVSISNSGAGNVYAGMIYSFNY